jgi:hypothetical protein
VRDDPVNGSSHPWVIQEQQALLVLERAERVEQVVINNFYL